jgi:hypothetical protein
MFYVLSVTIGFRYNLHIVHFDVSDNQTYKGIFNFQFPRLEEVISQATLYPKFLLDICMLPNCRYHLSEAIIYSTEISVRLLTFEKHFYNNTNPL